MVRAAGAGEALSTTTAARADLPSRRTSRSHWRRPRAPWTAGAKPRGGGARWTAGARPRRRPERPGPGSRPPATGPRSSGALSPPPARCARQGLLPRPARSLMHQVRASSISPPRKDARRGCGEGFESCGRGRALLSVRPPSREMPFSWGWTCAPSEGGRGWRGRRDPGPDANGPSTTRALALRGFYGSHSS